MNDKSTSREVYRPILDEDGNDTGVTTEVLAGFRTRSYPHRTVFVSTPCSHGPYWELVFGRAMEGDNETLA